MKTNWPQVVSELRKIVQENVTIVGADAAATKVFAEYFRITLFSTDTFHPFGTDKLLSDALSYMPEYCNYRSLKSYWLWKDSRVDVANALEECTFEIQDLITEWFSDNWNHPPGYVKPKEIVFKWEAIWDHDKAAGRIIRAAKK